MKKDRNMEINGIEVSPALSYRGMNLSPGILQALEKKGFLEATPVQAGAIPYFMDWQDVIAKAPTGTGKRIPSGSRWFHILTQRILRFKR